MPKMPVFSPIYGYVNALYSSPSCSGCMTFRQSCAAGFPETFIVCGVSKPVYFLFTALFAVGYAAFWLLCWRCPFCGGRLGRSDGESCPHCGKALDPGARRPAE